VVGDYTHVASDPSSSEYKATSWYELYHPQPIGTPRLKCSDHSESRRPRVDSSSRAGYAARHAKAGKSTIERPQMHMGRERVCKLKIRKARASFRRHSQQVRPIKNTLPYFIIIQHDVIFASNFSLIGTVFRSKTGPALATARGGTRADLGRVSVMVRRTSITRLQRVAIKINCSKLSQYQIPLKLDRLVGQVQVKYTLLN
jgi:hypothetical protein